MVSNHIYLGPTSSSSCFASPHFVLLFLLSSVSLPLSSFYDSILPSSFSSLYPPSLFAPLFLLLLYPPFFLLSPLFTFLLFPLSSLPPSLCPLLTSPSLPSFPWFRLQPAIACLPGSSRTLSYIPFSFAIEVVAPPLHDGTNTIFTTTAY